MRTFALILITASTLLLPPKKKIKVWMIGDSTMAIKETKAFPETGWGMPFVFFFDSTVTVDNRAKNGRSTRSFIEEKRWQPVADSMQEGDYVIIQFGHNDEVPTKATYTKPEDFKNFLLKYINETKAKKAIPVLLTPVARRKFNADGKVEGTHEEYSAIVRDVAKQTGVAFIDLDRESQELLQQWGADKSNLLYNHLAAGEHPNYPQGKDDNTHFSELGARIMAELVLKEVRDLHLELADRVVK